MIRFLSIQHHSFLQGVSRTALSHSSAPSPDHSGDMSILQDLSKFVNETSQIQSKPGLDKPSPGVYTYKYKGAAVLGGSAPNCQSANASLTARVAAGRSTRCWSKNKYAGNHCNPRHHMDADAHDTLFVHTTSLLSSRSEPNRPFTQQRPVPGSLRGRIYFTKFAVSCQHKRLF